MGRDSRPGFRPVWNYVGVAFAVGVLVVLFVPAAPELREQNAPTTQAPGRTITLDELRAMLTDSPGEPPPSFQVDTPEGPVTVVVPPTTPTTTSTTTTAAPPTTQTTTTTTVPRPRPTLPPVDTGDIIDSLLGQAVPTTIPEEANGGPE